MAATIPVASATTLHDVVGLPAADTRLPVLQHAACQMLYHTRSTEETEEAYWYSTEMPDTLVEAQQVHLKSINSKQDAMIIFSNSTRYRVRALWLDFNGDEVAYSMLEPHSTKRYHTYITHPWIVREVNSGTRMLLSGRPAVVGMSRKQVVEVQAPPELTWSLETHSCFPDPFKQSVKALLLAHKKLEQCSDTAYQQPSHLASFCHEDDRSCTSKKRAWSGIDPSTATSVPPRCWCLNINTAVPPASHSHYEMQLPSTSFSHIADDSSGSDTATQKATSPKSSIRTSTLHSATIETDDGTATSVYLASVLGYAMIDAGNSGAACTSMSDAGIAVATSAAPAKRSKRAAEMLSDLLIDFKSLMNPKRRQPAHSTCSNARTQTTCTQTCNLGTLPGHLLFRIAELAAPTIYQNAKMSAKGRPDIQPILMACPPKTKEEEAAEAAQ